MEVQKDAWNSKEQMAIMDRYDRVVAYLYPIAQSMPRKHGVARDMFLRALLGQAELFYVAGKSNQVSKIYQADAGLAHVRFWMRFLVSIHCMTLHQLQTAQVLLAEVGGMLGAWVKNQKKGQEGK
jgi:hypothetical protein